MDKVLLVTAASRGIGAATTRLAAAILWLLSDAAPFTTGSFIDVAGGR
ncbi:hypothetical protein ACFSQE_10715 [Vogesella fluminis]|uniref:Short-chain dehydrogenase n=1 Tax=Vogesella fluminis TaxID=1069161 RepID=A0ABQ3HB05_9NEIS|nr:hypothetical protein [Vogesella fluminis]GHD79697.1 hypothetical protein GCM10011419_23430 [Vogesella fluminis]